MKQMAFSKVLMVVVCTLMLCGLAPTLGGADTAQYFYDGLGRLTAVLDGQGNIASYHYDAVGNLLSITRSTGTAPAITSISPSTIDAGTSTIVTITGTGLLLGQLSSSNPEIQFFLLSQSDSALSARFIVPNPTAFGQTTVRVTRAGDTASTILTVRQPTPTITQLSPSSGVPGDVVVISGTGFGTKPGSNRVTFAGAGSSRLVATVSSHSFTSLTVLAPPGVTAGPATVEVGGLTSNTVTFTAPPVLTAITPPAAQGIAANPGVASANIGQVIQLVGSGFPANMSVRFTGVSSTGIPLTEVVSPVNVSPDGTTANVIVPNLATTGMVTVQNFDFQTIYPGILLQVVPTLTALNGQSFGPGALVTLSGRGFKASATTVIFPGVAAPVPVTTILGSNDRLTATVPAGVTTGPLTVRTDGGTSNGFIIGLPGITPVAAQGVPLNPAVGSANAFQTIQLQGSGFTPATTVVFQTMSDTGVAGTVNTFPFNISPDGTTANVAVPTSATTGFLSISGVGGITLQIVPTVTFLNVPIGETFRPDVVASLSGSGFIEGATTVTFTGTTPVSAADVGNTNGTLTVTVPTGATPGPLTVSTDGGTSNTLILRNPLLTGITAAATLGTPADFAQPSANVGQSIVLTGTDFGLFTNARLPGFDGTGAPVSYTANGIPSPDGTSLTIQVPQFFGIVSGAVTVVDVMTHLGTGTVVLQIVPTVTSLTGTLVEGTTLQITGGGFTPTGTQVQFPGAASPVAPDQASILSSGGTQLSVVVPAGVDPTGQLTVVTPGGLSNPFDLTSTGETEPNDTPAAATLLTIDQNTFDVTKSARIDPAGDVDYYKFNADFSTFGTAYQVEVLPGLTPGPPLTIRLTWFDQDGVTVLNTTEGSVDIGGGTVSFQIEPAIEGIYFIKVEELNNQGGSEHTYQIRLSVVAQ